MTSPRTIILSIILGIVIGMVAQSLLQSEKRAEVRRSSSAEALGAASHASENPEQQRATTVRPADVVSVGADAEPPPAPTTTRPSRFAKDDEDLLRNVARFLKRDADAVVASVPEGADLSELRATLRRESVNVSRVSQAAEERARAIQKLRIAAGDFERHELSDSDDRETKRQEWERREPRTPDEHVMSGVYRDERSGKVIRQVVRILPGQDPEFDRAVADREAALRDGRAVISERLGSFQRR